MEDLKTSLERHNAEFEALRLAFVEKGDDEVVVNRKMVEAVATCAAYNMVSRFLVALDVDDLCIVKGSDDLEDTVYCSNVGQERVSETCSC